MYNYEARLQPSALLLYSSEPYQNSMSTPFPLPDPVGFLPNAVYIQSFLAMLYGLGKRYTHALGTQCKVALVVFFHTTQ